VSEVIGHSLVAMEFVQGGRYESVVADLLPYVHPTFNGRASQMDLILGSAGGHALKGRIRILGTDGQTIAEKVKRPFVSETWQRGLDPLNAALLLIGEDAAATTQNPGHNAYASNSYSYSFLGVPIGGSVQTSESRAKGFNCANWVRRVWRRPGWTAAPGCCSTSPSSRRTGGGGSGSTGSNPASV